MACPLSLGLVNSCLSVMPPVVTPFTISYQAQATTAVGKVSAAAEDKKTSNYSILDQANLFMPVAMETLGPFGPK